MSATNEIMNEIIKHSLLMKIGSKAVLIIKQRTAKGIFLSGSSSNANRYSTKPFAMPLGAVKKKDVLWKMLKGEYNDETELFRTKSKRLWVVIKRGYKWLREKSGKQSSRVDMRWSGKLLRSLRVLKVDPASGVIEIGHGDAQNKKLAEYHNVLGAGKSKRLHKYLGLTEKELEEMVKRI